MGGPGRLPSIDSRGTGMNVGGPIYQETVMPQATTVSPQAAVNTARAVILAYNEKDWDKGRAALTPDFRYDEVPTHRRLNGPDETIAAWQGWARAFPDSKGSIEKTHAAGDTVVFEVTWSGTHQGPLDTPKGSIPASGKRIEVRAVLVTEVAGERSRAQRHYFDLATLLEQVGAK